MLFLYKFIGNNIFLFKVFNIIFFFCVLPINILVNTVEAGLRFVFTVTGQVEGEDTESIRSIRGSRNLDILEDEKK